jgi:tRNA pseudouridine38-40 synthase
VQRDLDLAAMRRGLAVLLGEHDFTSFSSSSVDHPGTTCTVIRAELIDLPPLLIIEIEADRFLYHMVRFIAGTLLEIGRGNPLSIKEILDARDRTRAGHMAPPHALYLKRVTY